MLTSILIFFPKIIKNLLQKNNTSARGKTWHLSTFRSECIHFDHWSDIYCNNRWW